MHANPLIWLYVALVAFDAFHDYFGALSGITSLFKLF